MKLSEAILLGSTVMAPRAGIQYQHTAEGQSGCAFGMAAVARGFGFSQHFGPIPPGENSRSLGVPGVWGLWVMEKVKRPCYCWLSMPYKMQIQEIVTHLFDQHVMEKKDWTLDQLVEWVRTVEPAQIAIDDVQIVIDVRPSRVMGRDEFFSLLDRHPELQMDVRDDQLIILAERKASVSREAMLQSRSS